MHALFLNKSLREEEDFGREPQIIVRKSYRRGVTNL